MKTTMLVLGTLAFTLTTAPAMAQMAPKMTKSQMTMAKKCKAMSSKAMMRNKTCMSMKKKGMMDDSMMSGDKGMMSDGSMTEEELTGLSCAGVARRRMRSEQYIIPLSASDRSWNFSSENSGPNLGPSQLSLAAPVPTSVPQCLRKAIRQRSRRRSRVQLARSRVPA